MLNLKRKSSTDEKDICSFCIVNKDDFFPDEDIIEDATNYFDESQITNTVFWYDDKLIQEYNLLTGANALFCEIGNNQLAHLYEHEVYENGDEIYTIYEKDGVYYMFESNGKMQRLVYANKDDYNKVTTKFKNDTPISIINKINTYRSDRFINSNVDIIVDNCIYIPTDRNKALSEKFRKSFMRYKMSECLIPSEVIISEIKSMVNHYIVTHKLDSESLLNNYMVLSAFGDFCHSSIDLISPFVHNPKNTDLQKLSEGLDKKIDDIDYLIHLYLEEELKCASRNQNQEKGEH